MSRPPKQRKNIDLEALGKEWGVLVADARMISAEHNAAYWNKKITEDDAETVKILVSYVGGLNHQLDGIIHRYAVLKDYQNRNNEILGSSISWSLKKK